MPALVQNPMSSSARSSLEMPPATALGVLLREVVDELNVKPRKLFQELSLGAPLLTREALFVTCRSRLGLKQSSFPDEYIKVS
jgi:hypothetical protein